MNFYQTLMLAGQIHQSYALNRLNSAVDDLQNMQAQQIADQKRLQNIYTEIDEFSQIMQKNWQTLDAQPGLAAYWAFRFLIWCEEEQVNRRAMPDMESKEYFSGTLAFAQESLQRCRAFYSEEDMMRIQKLVHLDTGFLTSLKNLLNWKKIHTAMQSKWFYSKHLRTRNYIIVFLLPLMLCAALPIEAVFILIMLPIAITTRVIHNIKQGDLKKLVPLATEVGGTLSPKVTIADVSNVLHKIMHDTHNKWGIETNLSVGELESAYTRLKAEYDQSVVDFLKTSPPAKSEPDMLQS